MAERAVAERRTPASRGNSPHNTDGPSAADLLENRLAQLKSLLWCCYGDGIDWFNGAGPTHLGNVIWLAADMVDQAVELHQRCLSERRAPT
ncbi:hypothetical protein GNX71_20270 [Variovorax sp. RKNM96]|uniref:hypothetical protein n=1 Tax=Variovorax sp. RKNM96 TaxID=2681552 RepID=UPI00198108DB|nr:hypothetical protein [Variovorax sp. RKNM96]QSI31788.1 hypothetical protein GNX71_20270 [Variovorax sp. RKNM96]